MYARLRVSSILPAKDPRAVKKSRKRVEESRPERNRRGPTLFFWPLLRSAPLTIGLDVFLRIRWTPELNVILYLRTLQDYIQSVLVIVRVRMFMLLWKI